MAGEPFAQAGDVATAWRPLSSEEQARATHWIGVATRRIRRRWRDVDERLALAVDDPRHLAADDLKDVVVTLVVDVLGGPEIPHARAVSVGSGAESRSVQLDRASGLQLPDFAGWMVEIFEGRPGPAVPTGSFPRPLPLNGAFVTKEIYR